MLCFHHYRRKYFDILNIFFIYLERGEGKEKERERNADVREKHWSVASCTHHNQDQVENWTGNCQWELNWGLLLYGTMLNQLNPGLLFFFTGFSDIWFQRLWFCKWKCTYLNIWFMLWNSEAFFSPHILHNNKLFAWVPKYICPFLLGYNRTNQFCNHIYGVSHLIMILIQSGMASLLFKNMGGLHNAANSRKMLPGKLDCYLAYRP